MPLRDKLQRPLRRAISDKLKEGGDPNLRVLLVHPFKLARLAAQVEVLASQKGVSGELDALDVGDSEDTPGFLTTLAWLVENWAEIYELAKLILPLVLNADGQTASEE